MGKYRKGTIGYYMAPSGALRVKIIRQNWAGGSLSVETEETPPRRINIQPYEFKEFHGCAATRAACQSEGDAGAETPCSCSCHNDEEKTS